MIQPWEYGILPKSWVKPMNMLIDELWVPSNYVRQCYVASGIDPNKVIVIPNGVDEKFNVEAPSINIETNKSFKFLFVGGTIFRKGIDVLLKAYTKCFKNTDDVCLVIKDVDQDTFYKGQCATRIIKQIQSNPRAPEILYIPVFIPEAQIAGLYTACNCLVHPYRGEGFGLPVAEAMACGLPVIVTKGGSCDDFCSDNTVYWVPAKRRSLHLPGWELAGNAWILEPDVNSLVKQMRYVFENRIEAKDVGLAASKHIHETLSWKMSADIVLQRLQTLQKRPILRENSVVRN